MRSLSRGRLAPWAPSRVIDRWTLLCDRWARSSGRRFERVVHCTGTRPDRRVSCLFGCTAQPRMRTRSARASWASLCVICMGSEALIKARPWGDPKKTTRLTHAGRQATRRRRPPVPGRLQDREISLARHRAGAQPHRADLRSTQALLRLALLPASARLSFARRGPRRFAFAVPAMNARPIHLLPERKTSLHVPNPA